MPTTKLAPRLEMLLDVDGATTAIRAKAVAIFEDPRLRCESRTPTQGTYHVPGTSACRHVTIAIIRGETRFHCPCPMAAHRTCAHAIAASLKFFEAG
jgi:hypothetical protein